MSKTMIIVCAVIGAILLGIFSVVGYVKNTYNDVKMAEQQVNNKWGQVENLYQTRQDKIGQLVKVVEGYAFHEKGVIDSITAARAKLASAQTPVNKDEANKELSGALSRLLVAAENYPNLKADAHFSDLMREISGSENRINIARKDYNDEVTKFNSRLVTFPNNILAGFFNFQAKQLFQMDAGAGKAPDINFNSLKPAPAKQ